MTSIHSIKQHGHDQQGPQQNEQNFFPADTKLRHELKHDGNKTNYTNQVSLAVGDEEE